jgi:hypothetical protein
MRYIRSTDRQVWYASLHQNRRTELDVLRGLTRPAGTLSFEVTPELLSLAEQCLARLEALGYRKFQMSNGESMRICDRWLDGNGTRSELPEISQFEDIYALAPHG